MKRPHELGMVHPLVITAIVLSIFTVGFGAFSVWAFLNYQDQKNNVDAKVAVAVADAKRAQSTTDQTAFAEQEKEPNRQIVGPADLGQVKLSYPKTWSVYVEKQSSTAYEAYFFPLTVPAIASNTPYALRISIVDSKYESVLAAFNDRLKTGGLKASPITVSGVDGTRLDGVFTPTVNGSMVLFKIRDKTLQVYTQSQTYRADFDNTILKSLQFNK
jgi:hypothetical protein